MGVKKDIGKALNESLKGLKLSPDEKVWDRIQATLNAKKRKRKILFWSRSFAVGLLTIFLCSIIYNSLNKENLKPEILKTKNNSSPSKANKIQEDVNDIIDNTEVNKNLINDQSEIKSTNKNSRFLNKKDSLNYILNHKNYFKNKVNDELINSKNKNLTKNSSIRNKTDNRKINTQTNKNSINFKDKNNALTSNNNSSRDNDFKKGDKRGITSNKTLSNESTLKHGNQLNSTNKDKLLDTLSTRKKIKELLKKDNIVASLDSLNTKDSLSTKITLQDSILPKKDIEKKILPKKESFWDVTFYVAPTYYNTLSKGSTFGNNFVNHKKKGGISLNYRVTFDIKFSEKLNLRTGFGKVNLNYTTIDVSTTTSTGTIPNLTEFDGISYDFRALENIYSNELLEPLTSLNFKQKIGYFEIPVELVYKFPSKKLKWKIIGGGSALKITNNSIIAESSNGDYTIGKSNNLSEYSYSANFGGGFDYPISKKLKINVEPMFKYHLKTFSRETANFKPYSFSIFIGTTYKF
ncbi:MAG: hypothetical protein COA67_09895 [Lutibacter sp.]|nr:MAG: hypothetical protein COA67_09895 [Lutibacter sp.]